MTPAALLISAARAQGLAWSPAPCPESPVSTPLFPLFLDLSGRQVLVVGAGTVAARKIQPLLDAGARVRVGALALGADVAQLLAAGRIEFLSGEFSESWLDGAWLVLAATDDDDVNRQVAAAAPHPHPSVNGGGGARPAAFPLPGGIERGPF